MAIDKSLISGNTDMLILKLLEKQDMYGYQMIEELAKQSDHRQLRHLYEAVSCHNPTFL